METVECSVQEEAEKLMSLHERIGEAEMDFEVQNQWNDYEAGDGQRSGLSNFSKNPDDRNELVNMYRAMNSKVQHEDVQHIAQGRVNYVEKDDKQMGLLHIKDVIASKKAK